MEKNRINYIDIAKGIGILLVMLGHLLDSDALLKTAIYSFHMPLFFIVSGMVLKPQSIVKKVNRQINNILVPYVLWAVIFSGFSFYNLIFIGYGSNESLLKVGSNGMLWFLSVMFFASVISQAMVTLLDKMKRNNVTVIVFIIILLCLAMVLNKFHDQIVIYGMHIGYPLAVDIVLLAVAFMLFGSLLKDYKRNPGACADTLRWYHIILAFIMIFVSVVGVFYKMNHEYPHMATGDVGNYIIFFMVACSASTGVIVLSRYLEKFKYISNIMKWFGKNSMGIFIMHRTVRYYLLPFYEKHHSVFVFVICYLIMILYSSISTVIIKRFCPALLGKTGGNA